MGGMVVRHGSGVGAGFVSRIVAAVVAAGLLLGVGGIGPAEAFVCGPVNTLVAGPEARGDIKAFGDYVVCPEAEVVYLDPIAVTTGPFRVILYDVVNGGFLDIDERPGSHAFADIGDGFVAYVTSDEITVAWELRLYDIVTGARSVLATGPAGSAPVPECASHAVAWSGVFDTELHVFDVDTGTKSTYATPDGCANVSADGGRVAWVDAPLDTGKNAGVNVLDVATGEVRRLRLDAFSMLSCDVSEAGVVIEGEGPDYRPRILMWDPDEGTVLEIASATRGYVSNACISSGYVAWTVLPEDGSLTRAVAAMNLADGSLCEFDPPITSCSIGDLVGSRIWYLAILNDGSTAIRYVDLDYQPPPVTPRPAPIVATPAPSAEETTSAEPSATVVATEAPESEGEPEPEAEPDEMSEEEGEAERNGAVPLLAGGLAVVLAGIGVVAYSRTRRSA